MSGTLDDLQQELGAALAGLDAKAVQYRPAEPANAWSIQQIAEHLLLTYDRMLRGFEEQLLAGRCTTDTVKAWQRMGQIMVGKMGHFPEGRTAPAEVAPPLVMPPESGDAIFARISARIAAMKMIFVEAEQAFGAKRCVSHLVLGPMSVEGWRGFHLAHGRHHIQQMTVLRKELGL